MLSLPTTLANAKESDEIFLVECYIFYLKTGNFYVCAADQNITINGIEFYAAPIQRDKFTANSDSKIDDCTLKVTNVDDRFTAALYAGTDFRGCRCDIYQVLYPQILTDYTQAKPILIGGYMDCPILNQKEATMEVTIKAKIPNMKNARYFQLSCNAEFADGDCCMASKDTQSGSCQHGTTQSSIVINVARDDGYWNNGIITCGSESRMVQSSVGPTVLLHYPFTVIPTTYTIERGCDKSLPNCKTIGQAINFTGFPGIPMELTIRSE